MRSISPGSEIGKLPLAHAANQTQRFGSRGPKAGEFAQRRIMEYDEGRDAALGGNFTAQSAQALKTAPRRLPAR